MQPREHENLFDGEQYERILRAGIPFGIPALNLTDQTEEYRRGSLVGYNSRDQFFDVPDGPSTIEEEEALEDYLMGWIEGAVLSIAEEFGKDPAEYAEETSFKFATGKYDVWDMLDSFRGEEDERKGIRPWRTERDLPFDEAVKQAADLLIRRQNALFDELKTFPTADTHEENHELLRQLSGVIHSLLKGGDPC